MTFDYFKPYHDDDTSFIYRSIIGKYDPSINGGKVDDRNVYKPHYLRKKYFAFNSSLLQVIWFAYGPWFNFQDINYNRLKVITKDSSRFLFPSKFTGYNNSHISLNDWIAKNCFSYEINLPAPVSDTVFGQMILEDMHRNFQFHSMIEQAEMDGWVITKIPQRLDLPQNDTLSINVYEDEMVAKNVTLNELIDFIEINCGFRPDPIVNETKDERHFNLHLKSGGKSFTLSNVINFMRQAGFSIERKKVKSNILVLKRLKKEEFPPLSSVS